MKTTKQGVRDLNTIPSKKQKHQPSELSKRLTLGLQCEHEWSKELVEDFDEVVTYYVWFNVCKKCGDRRRCD